MQLARVWIRRRQHANAFFVVDADGATAVTTAVTATADGQQVVVYLCTSERMHLCSSCSERVGYVGTGEID